MQDVISLKMATTSGKEKFYGVQKTPAAYQKRNAQLQVWEKSDTNKQPDYIVPRRQKTKVKFDDSVVFLAAVQSGDYEEVERLIQEDGADVSSVNKDGLTALHQCCIDDDFEMVKVLIKHKANVDAQDHEGWTPLHAAASCGHEHIVRYLLDHGSFPSPINNEGDSPVDLAEDDAIVEMLTEQVEKQGIDVEEVRGVEEEIMLKDANRIKKDPSLTPTISPGGASPLHVAASKNYLRVIKVLLSTKGTNVEAQDDDGWTPLHAAVYWGNMEAAEVLVLYGADLNAVNTNGDTIEELCDAELAEELEQLRKLKEEQSSRTRRNAMILTRNSRPSLTHTNSREDIKPITPVKRRSSKERSLYPKIDMAKEREEREHWTTETTVTNSIGAPKPSSNSIVVNILEESKQEAAKEPLIEEENSWDSPESGGSNVSLTNHQPPDVAPKPAGSPQGSPRDSPKTSPKLAKKKSGMSAQMLKRVNLWESQVSTPDPNAPEATTPTTGGAPAPAPRTSTPTSLPIIAESGKAATDVKRFPFQPKTIPQLQKDRSVSEVRPAELKRADSYLEAMTKRGSLDEARLKAAGLQLPDDLVSKSSSLPRGAKIGTEVCNLSITPPTERKDVPSMKEGGVVSSEGAATPSSVTEEENLHRDLSRGASVESSGSTSSHIGQSETRRKSRARRSRETRKATQPVPMDIMKKISEFDAKGDVISSEVRQQIAELDPRVVEQMEEEQGMEGENTEAASAKEKTEVQSPQVEYRPVQSAYKPKSRPAPRLSQTKALSPAMVLSLQQLQLAQQEKTEEEALPPPQVVTTPAPDLSQEQQSTKLEEPSDHAHLKSVEDNLSPSPRPGTIKEEELGVDEEDSCHLSPSRDRAKSTARRRPRKERRSTGIVCEAEDGEEVPEKLAGVVKTKPESDPDEVTRLKQLLEEERVRCQQLEEKHRRELESHKARISELQRRYEDTSRAYEQERRERESREERIVQLEEGSKNLQDLKNENQRLKDENGALIRVIGKLSRTPVPHT